MSKDAPLAKKPKYGITLGKRLYNPSTPMQKKGHSNIFPWTSSLICPNLASTMPSSPLWTKDALKQLNSSLATKPLMERASLPCTCAISYPCLEPPSASFLIGIPDSQDTSPRLCAKQPASNRT